MQRLDRQSDTGVARMGKDRLEAFLHHATRGADVARPLGQAADDEDETVGTECRGLVDCRQVILDRGPDAGGIAGGKHAAAADARHPQAVGVDDVGSFPESDGLDLVAPGRDRRDAALETGVDRLGKAVASARRRQIDRETLDGHHSDPARVMRVQSGSAAEPRPTAAITEPMAISPCVILSRARPSCMW